MLFLKVQVRLSKIFLKTTGMILCSFLVVPALGTIPNTILPKLEIELEKLELPSWKIKYVN